MIRFIAENINELRLNDRLEACKRYLNPHMLQDKGTGTSILIKDIQPRQLKGLNDFIRGKLDEYDSIMDKLLVW